MRGDDRKMVTYKDAFSKPFISRVTHNIPKILLLDNLATTVMYFVFMIL